MTVWIPGLNPDHVVELETETVITGRKTFKELVTEELENPLRDLADRQLLKLNEEKLRIKYKLDTLNIPT